MWQNNNFSIVTINQNRNAIFLVIFSLKLINSFISHPIQFLKFYIIRPKTMARSIFWLIDMNPNLIIIYINQKSFVNNSFFFSSLISTKIFINLFHCIRNTEGNMINLLLNKVIQMKDRLITGHLKIRFQCGFEVGLMRTGTT